MLDRQIAGKTCNLILKRQPITSVRTSRLVHSLAEYQEEGHGGPLGGCQAQGLSPCPRVHPQRGCIPRDPGSRYGEAWHSLLGGPWCASKGQETAGTWRKSGNYRSFGGSCPSHSPISNFLEFPGLILSPDFTPMICCHCPVPKLWPHRHTDIGKQTDRWTEL